MSVQTYYKQLKWILSQTPLEKDKGIIEPSVIENYNSLVDKIAAETKRDLGSFKVTDRDRWNENAYEMGPFRIQMGSLIGYLEAEFGLEEIAPFNTSGGMGITVINQNTVAVTVSQTIPQIIEKAEGAEEKEKLEELQKELEKPEKDWSKIRAILKWVLDFSEKLFFQLLPILLKHYGMPV